MLCNQICTAGAIFSPKNSLSFFKVHCKSDFVVVCSERFRAAATQRFGDCTSCIFLVHIFSKVPFYVFAVATVLYELEPYNI